MITIHRGIYYSCKLYNSYNICIFVQCSTTTYNDTILAEGKSYCLITGCEGSAGGEAKKKKRKTALSAPGNKAYVQRRLAKRRQFKRTN